MATRNQLGFGLVLLLACGLLSGCFSSSGGGGGSRPAPGYVVLPNGQTVPVQHGSP